MIKNMKIRFNLNNENDRKAYDYLHSAEKSYSKAVISAICEYLRLSERTATNLIPEILKYVDEGRISFTPAVELSYLNEQEQQDLLEQIEQSDCTPSLSQACRFKKISQAEGLTPEVIAEIMSEDKANQKERIKIPTEKLRKYFPKNYTVEQIENEIIKLCEKNYRNKQRDAR